MKPVSDSEPLLPTPRMVRAARGLLGMDQAVLAKEVGVDRKTIVRVETDTREKIDARRRTVLKAIKSKFEEGFNIQFIFPDEQTGEGVRFRRDDRRVS